MKKNSSLRFNPQSYRILDFYEWNSRKELHLQPKFQRRDSWTEKARSYLIDSIIRGLPIPKIFLREITDTKNKITIREVVDGQQRLRAVLDFIAGNLKILKVHNENYYGKIFSELSEEVQESFFRYRFSVDLLEGATDSDVLNIFSRLNSYTLTLKPQEKLNAEFFGPFKNCVYDLAYRHYNYWLDNKIFTDKQIARMDECELTSELVIAMLDGLQQGKTYIRNYYDKYDNRFLQSKKIKKEFSLIINLLSETLGDALQTTRFRRIPLFYSLFCVFYDAKYSLPKSSKRKIIFTNLVMKKARESLLAINEEINWREPQNKYNEFVTAAGKGTAFLKYRKIRHDFIWNVLFK
ncbi:MAG: DUF262 domain-containing protein [Bacteroidota bacterium]